MPESGQGDVSLVGLGSQSVSVYFKCTLSGHRREKMTKISFYAMSAGGLILLKG